MAEQKGKILGALLFVVLILGLFYLVFSSKKTNKGEIKMIEITGNNLLPKNDYLKFTKLENNSDFSKLTLAMIRERFEKHPYVEKADIAYEGNKTAKVYLKEKKIEAIILINGEPQFITEDFQILPMLPDIKMLDLPVISNPDLNGKITPLSYVRTNDIEEAFKIIEAAKLTNINMYKKLSEINLRNGGDIILTFSGIKPPILFGRGEDASKMVYLDVTCSGMTSANDLVDNSQYIDLRFSNEIYVGTDDRAGLKE